MPHLPGSVTMYRAREVFDDAGLRLGQLVEWAGRSRSTWSRLLNGKLDPEPAGIREEMQAFLREQGIEVPPDLWRRANNGAPAPEPKGVQLMRGQTLWDETAKHFRLFRSPFDPDAIVGPDGENRLDDLYLPMHHRFAELRLVQALTGAGFVAMHGEPGSGKSTLLARALKVANGRKSMMVITPANVERRKMTAMHIAAEIIRQLSEENVPRTANVRDHVATEVLKQHYQQGRRVALVIDEAHELPDTTLKDLKRYHELSDSMIRLLAVVLVGQTELAQRFELERNHRLREAIIRCQLIPLPPMQKPGDVRNYMQTRFRWVGADLDAVWEPAAVEELERRLGEHDQQIPVLIGNMATAAMNLAFRLGDPKVTTDAVIELTMAKPQQLREWGLG